MTEIKLLCPQLSRVPVAVACKGNAAPALSIDIDLGKFLYRGDFHRSRETAFAVNCLAVDPESKNRLTNWPDGRIDVNFVAYAGRVARYFHLATQRGV